MLRIGDAAPDFEAPVDGGGVIRLSDLRGRKVVLYFYPNDSTPTCTVEACTFRAMHPGFAAKKVAVVGVSGNSVESHDRFKVRHRLPFPLVSDPDRRIATAYGARRKKKLLWIEYMSSVRTTYVIDEEGKITAVYHNVANVFAHASRVLGDIEKPA